MLVRLTIQVGWSEQTKCHISSTVYVRFYAIYKKRQLLPAEHTIHVWCQTVFTKWIPFNHCVWHFHNIVSKWWCIILPHILVMSKHRAQMFYKILALVMTEISSNVSYCCGVVAIIPSAQRSCWGVYWFHSVRPSVRPSVRSSRVKNWNFGNFLNNFNFDFVLFWLGIWCESPVWVIMGRRGVYQNAGVLVVLVNAVPILMESEMLFCYALVQNVIWVT